MSSLSVIDNFFFFNINARTCFGTGVSRKHIPSKTARTSNRRRSSWVIYDFRHACITNISAVLSAQEGERATAPSKNVHLWAICIAHAHAHTFHAPWLIIKLEILRVCWTVYGYEHGYEQRYEFNLNTKTTDPCAGGKVAGFAHSAFAFLIIPGNMYINFDSCKCKSFN